MPAEGSTTKKFHHYERIKTSISARLSKHRNLTFKRFKSLLRSAVYSIILRKI